MHKWNLFYFSFAIIWCILMSSIKYRELSIEIPPFHLKYYWVWVGRKVISYAIFSSSVKSADICIYLADMTTFFYSEIMGNMFTLVIVSEQQLWNEVAKGGGAKLKAWNMAEGATYVWCFRPSLLWEGGNFQKWAASRHFVSLRNLWKLWSSLKCHRGPIISLNAIPQTKKAKMKVALKRVRGQKCSTKSFEISVMSDFHENWKFAM